MKRLLACALLVLSSLAPATAQSIGGNYSVEGTNFDGSPYSGTAKITITSETTCVIEWATGGTASSGICMRNDTSFAAGYGMGNDIGLVVYKVHPDGSLEGLWTIAGKDGNGTETLTPAN